MCCIYIALNSFCHFNHIKQRRSAQLSADSAKSETKRSSYSKGKTLTSTTISASTQLDMGKREYIGKYSHDETIGFRRENEVQLIKDSMKTIGAVEKLWKWLEVELSSKEQSAVRKLVHAKVKSDLTPSLLLHDSHWITLASLLYRSASAEFRDKLYKAPSIPDSPTATASKKTIHSSSPAGSTNPTPSNIPSASPRQPVSNKHDPFSNFRDSPYSPTKQRVYRPHPRVFVPVPGDSIMLNTPVKSPYAMGYPNRPSRKQDVKTENINSNNVQTSSATSTNQYASDCHQHYAQSFPMTAGSPTPSRRPDQSVDDHIVLENGKLQGYSVFDDRETMKHSLSTELNSERKRDSNTSRGTSLTPAASRDIYYKTPSLSYQYDIVKPQNIRISTSGGSISPSTLNKSPSNIETRPYEDVPTPSNSVAPSQSYFMISQGPNNLPSRFYPFQPVNRASVQLPPSQTFPYPNRIRLSYQSMVNTPTNSNNPNLVKPAARSSINPAIVGQSNSYHQGPRRSRTSSMVVHACRDFASPSTQSQPAKSNSGHSITDNERDYRPSMSCVPSDENRHRRPLPTPSQVSTSMKHRRHQLSSEDCGSEISSPCNTPSSSQLCQPKPHKRSTRNPSSQGRGSSSQNRPALSRDQSIEKKNIRSKSKQTKQPVRSSRSISHNRSKSPPRTRTQSPSKCLISNAVPHCGPLKVSPKRATSGQDVQSEADDGYKYQMKNNIKQSSLDSRSIPISLPPNKILKSTDIIIGKCLGTGGFGSVYAGVMQKTQQPVAIKKLHQSARSLKEEHWQEIVSEIQAIYHLQHPSLVEFVGICHHNDQFSIVSELCENGSLHANLHGNRKAKSIHHFTWAVRRKISIQMAEGVLFLHSLIPKVIHRDLKSLNVVLDENWNAKICDFGLTTSMNDLKSHISLKKGANGGSPRYMAPECFESKAKICEKVDIWAMGCILLEIFGGPLPFHDCTEIQHIVKRLVVEKRGPEIPLHFDKNLKRILTGCFQFEPSLRWDINKVLQCLKRLQEPDNFAPNV